MMSSTQQLISLTAFFYRFHLIVTDFVREFNKLATSRTNFILHGYSTNHALVGVWTAKKHPQKVCGVTECAMFNFGAPWILIRHCYNLLFFVVVVVNLSMISTIKKIVSRILLQQVCTLHWCLDQAFCWIVTWALRKHVACNNSMNIDENWWKSVDKKCGMIFVVIDCDLRLVNISWYQLTSFFPIK